VVAEDAQACREAMVAEWQESFAAGEDAAMVPEQNVEVERLNAKAASSARKPGNSASARSGSARQGAASDQVITRVNDRDADIYNRERWRVAEVDPDERRVVLEGIDQARTVEVDADYPDHTNQHSDAPALRHAYAVTVNSPQGYDRGQGLRRRRSLDGQAGAIRGETRIRSATNSS
jgi:hypothetical protein